LASPSLAAMEIRPTSYHQRHLVERVSIPQAHPSRPISRILSPDRGSAPSDSGHLSGMHVAAHLVQPTRSSTGTSSPRSSAACAPEDSPLLGLAPGGVCLAGTVAGPAGGLLHHLFTLTARICADAQIRPRYAFCGTVPSGRPAWPLASTALCGVRTFLMPFALWRTARDRLAGSDAD
jgi:hypothetical protein